MINKVILIGNLGADPEVRTLESGVMFAKLSLATNESYKDRNDEWQTITEWHNIVLWRGLAERAERQLKKGSQVFVEGKLTSRSYQDQDGNKKYITEIRANTFRLLGPKNTNDSMRTGTPEDKYAAVDKNKSKETPVVEDDAADDLPF